MYCRARCWAVARAPGDCHLVSTGRRTSPAQTSRSRCCAACMLRFRRRSACRSAVLTKASIAWPWRTKTAGTVQTTMWAFAETEQIAKKLAVPAKAACHSRSPLEPGPSLSAFASAPWHAYAAQSVWASSAGTAVRGPRTDSLSRGALPKKNRNVCGECSEHDFLNNGACYLGSLVAGYLSVRHG